MRFRDHLRRRAGGDVRASLFFFVNRDLPPRNVSKGDRFAASKKFARLLELPKNFFTLSSKPRAIAVIFELFAVEQAFIRRELLRQRLIRRFYEEGSLENEPQKKDARPPMDAVISPPNVENSPFLIRSTNLVRMETDVRKSKNAIDNARFVRFEKNEIFSRRPLDDGKKSRKILGPFDWGVDIHFSRETFGFVSESDRLPSQKILRPLARRLFNTRTR